MMKLRIKSIFFAVCGWSFIALAEPVRYVPDASGKFQPVETAVDIKESSWSEPNANFKINPSLKNAAIRSEIYALAQKGKLKEIKQILKTGVSIDEEDSYGNTNLCLAVYNHSPVAYVTLLNAGADKDSDCMEKIDKRMYRTFFAQVAKFQEKASSSGISFLTSSALVVGGGLAIAAAAGGGGGGGGGGSDGTDCKNGFFLHEGVCIPVLQCPDFQHQQGNACVCNTGHTGADCSACEVGYHIGNSGCVPLNCEAGYKVDGNQCVQCAAGSYSNQGDNVCTSCPANQVAKAGASACSACPANSTPNGDRSACNCETGYKGDTCNECDTGYEMTGGVCRKISCKAGFGLNDEKTACTQCLAGSFSTGGEGGECKPCPAGQISTQVGASSCSSCTGNREPNETQTACVCKSGFSGDDCTISACHGHGTFENGKCTCSTGYNSDFNCGDCADGYLKIDIPEQGTSVFVCNKLVSSCNNNGAIYNNKCVCLQGWTGNQCEKEAKTCQAGQYLNSSNNCTNCPKGYFMATQNSASQCNKCPAGTFTNETGATDCSFCGAGEISVAGSTSCTLCNTNEITNDDSSACIACTGNTYPDENKKNCVCKEGYTGEDCTDCIDGYISFSEDNQTACYKDLKCGTLKENSHQEKDTCVCNSGYVPIEGKCVLQQSVPGLIIVDGEDKNTNFYTQETALETANDAIVVNSSAETGVLAVNNSTITITSDKTVMKATGNNTYIHNNGTIKATTGIGMAGSEKAVLHNFGTVEAKTAVNINDSVFYNGQISEESPETPETTSSTITGNITAVNSAIINAGNITADTISLTGKPSTELASKITANEEINQPALLNKLNATVNANKITFTESSAKNEGTIKAEEISLTNSELVNAQGTINGLNDIGEENRTYTLKITADSGKIENSGILQGNEFVLNNKSSLENKNFLTVTDISLLCNH